ncbi:MAG TPA: hypothetical protein VEJ23_08770 [Solirubrobacteraceae bacterium]|nr:hypothetical protein [Solirubrobacteraceae bacterium]
MRRAVIFNRGLLAAGAVAVTATITLAAVALASNATPGATYVGHYTGRPTDEITFEVSGNGKKVIDLSVDTPFKCNGGCGGVGSPREGSATISKSGKFKAVLKILEPDSTTKSEGTDTVTGTFYTHGEAKGTVTSHFNKGSAGETVSWTAVS